MAKPRKKWSELSPAYRQRLRRGGVSPNTYNAGKANLKKARGHAATPERPERAFSRPDLYSDYLHRRIDSGKPVPENIVPRGPGGGRPTHPRAMSVAQIGDSIGYPSRENLSVHVIWRHPDIKVRQAGNVNADESTILNLADGPEQDAHIERVFPYDERDFSTLIKLIRDRGFIARVESGQYEWRITT